MCGARRCARLLLQLVQLPQVLKHAGARSPEPGPARPGLRVDPGNLSIMGRGALAAISKK